NGIATAGLTIATYALTAAQWLLNAAVSANPFVLLGIAIVGVGLYLGHLYNTSAKFRAILSGIGEVAKDLGVVFRGLGEAIIG
ncbi:hypothetical protein NL329_30695, partial [Klebsiella pneumoniae]|nr:hypothetical protein [Klebsiella pneumoniae]